LLVVEHELHKITTLTAKFGKGEGIRRFTLVHPLGYDRYNAELFGIDIDLVFKLSCDIHKNLASGVILIEDELEFGLQQSGIHLHIQ
jgi:hypothetical protein